MRLIKKYLLICIFLVGLTPIKGFECYVKSNGKSCEKWDKRTLTYHFSTSLLPSGHHQPDIFRKELKNAFDQWSQASGLTFVEVHSKTGAHIRISFEKESHGDCSKLGMQRRSKCSMDFGPSILAHSFPPEHQAGPGGKISPLRGELHINVNEKWSTGHAGGMIHHLFFNTNN